MRGNSERGHETETLRRLLAVLAMETKLIRLRHSLSRKYDPNQARAPAGQSDGGQWISDGGVGDRSIDRLPRGQGHRSSLDGGAPAGSPIRDEAVTEDGARILSLRIRSGRGDWDDQHAVVTSDGESRIFENSGDTQTIRDGRSGEVLSRATFTAAGIQTEPVFQLALLPALPLVVAPTIATTLEAAALLFTYLTARSKGFGPVLGLTARGYGLDRTTEDDIPIPWVGNLEKERLSELCPRSKEILSVTNRITAQIKSLNLPLSPWELGKLIHLEIARHFSFPPSPNLKAEFSLDKSGIIASYSRQDTIRLDLYEKTPKNMVWIYDFKTGKEGLSAGRALELYNAAKIHFKDAIGFIIVQVRPEV